MRSTVKARRYIFTYFPSESEDAELWTALPDGFRFICWQEESCPETGRRHLQGYIELKSPQRLNWVKRSMGCDHMHLEKCSGSRQQCIAYCEKEDSRISGPWRIGDLSGGGQGCRTDLQGLARAIMAGDGMEEIADREPEQVIRYSRGIRELISVRDAKLSRKFRTVQVYIWYGTAGAGKTRRCWEECGPELFILDQSSGGALWFDGYAGEDVLLLDDFYGWIKWGFFLRMLDGYPLRLPIKGSHAWAQWTTVVITSNAAPNTWYEKGMTKSFWRRITKIEYMSLDENDETLITEINKDDLL